MPEISIVIPFFNREKSILNAINSVLAQDFNDFEVLAVDDGSSDSSSEIVNSIKDPRVRLIRFIKNQGAQAARNAGIKGAKSTWVTFLDSDDTYLPQSLSSRYHFALDNKVQVVHSDCLIMKKEWKEPKVFNTIPLSGKVYSALLQRPGPTFPALFVTKEAFERIGYLDENVMAYQEWDTSIRLAKEFEFAFLNQPTFIYHIGSKNSISKNSYKSAQSYLQIVNKYESEIINHCGIKSLSDHYCSASIIYYRGSFKADALTYLKKALMINKFNVKYNLLAFFYHFGIKIPSR